MGKVTCGECKKSCKGQAVRLQDKYFHVKCFKCKECNKQLAAGGFYSKDNSFYCADDYQRLFGTKCAGCGKFVEGEVITALGNTYHQECFRCTKCRNHFGAGDKVTYNGQEYLCNKCLEKLELASSPRPASPKTGSVPPGSPNGHAPQQLQANMAPNLSSTPSRPVVDGHLGSPMSDDSNTYDKKYDHSGSAYETDEEELSGYLQSPHDPSNQKGRLSPIQQIMQYRTPSPVNSTISRSSQKSRESSGSYEPKYDVNYGRFYKTSFLKVTPQTGFKKGPSLNPADPPKSPHFHRPENFSYSQVRRDFVRPLKKGAPQQQSSQPPPPPQSWKKSSKQTYGMMSALGDTNTLMAKRKMESIVPMDNREAIKLSRFPDAHRPDVPRPPPIERDDWPAPPAPAAAYPEMLYEGHYRSKSEENLEEKKEEKIDPKIQKEIEELSKIMDSGVGKVILKDLKKKKVPTATLR